MVPHSFVRIISQDHLHLVITLLETPDGLLLGSQLLSRPQLPQPTLASPVGTWPDTPSQPSLQSCLCQSCLRVLFTPEPLNGTFSIRSHPVFISASLCLRPPILKSVASCSPLPAVLLTHGTPNPNHCLRRPLSSEHSAWARGSLTY